MIIAWDLITISLVRQVLGTGKREVKRKLKEISGSSQDLNPGPSGQFFQPEKILAHSGIVVWSQDLMLSDLPVLNGKSHQNYPCGTTPTYINHGGVSL